MHENDNEMPYVVETNKSIKIPHWKTMGDSLLKVDSVWFSDLKNEQQQ